MRSFCIEGQQTVTRGQEPVPRIGAGAEQTEKTLSSPEYTRGRVGAEILSKLVTSGPCACERSSYRAVAAGLNSGGSGHQLLQIASGA